MKKVKIAFWMVILGFLALLVYQNKDFFLSEHSLGINLYFFQKNTPDLPNAVLFAIFFLSGWLIAYFFSLFDRYKANKTIKNLNYQIASYQGTLDQMKQEIQALKPMPVAQRPEPPEGGASDEQLPKSDDAQNPQSSI